VTVLLESEMPRALSEAAAALLHWSGALGVELEDEDQLAPPGINPVAPGLARIRGHFQDLGAAQEALTTLRLRLGVQGEVDEVPETDWVAAVKARFTPRRIGGCYLAAPWNEGPTPEGLTRVIIEPGLAFGTGDHATTELCLEAIRDFLAQNPGASVLDVGSGSGVLAIAAKKLGAGRVAAIDTDPQALRETAENATRNDVAIEVVSLDGLDGTFELVVANILANTLAELASLLSSAVAPGGQLCLCGILGHQASSLVQSFSPWLREVERTQRGDWVLLKLSREGAHAEG
jgi:ribosomal protein L11 methyltransferase